MSQEKKIHEEANQMLKGFGYFFCNIFSARMSIRSCLKRQHDKDCATSHNCNQGVLMAKKNPKLNEEVLSEPKAEDRSKLGFRTSKNKPTSNQKEPKLPKPPKPPKPHCSYKDCIEPYIARKLCKKHYGLWRNGTLADYPAYTRKSAIPEKPKTNQEESKMADTTPKEEIKEPKTPLELTPETKERPKTLSVDGICEYCNTSIEFKNPDVRCIIPFKNVMLNLVQIPQDF